MASKEKREKIFSSYPIPKAVAALALPSVLSSIVNVIYNMADTYFVSLMKNTNATAAVSLTMPVFLFFFFLSGYFTFTLIFTVFLPDFTVIVTVPFFFAVITPLELTVAIFLLEDE